MQNEESRTLCWAPALAEAVAAPRGCGEEPAAGVRERWLHPRVPLGSPCLWRVCSCSRWCAIPEYPFLFLVHFPLWLLVVFLPIRQSSQSSLSLTPVLGCECVSLLCCVAYGLVTSRGEERCSCATSQSHEVMSKRECSRRELPACSRAGGSGSARRSETPGTQHSSEREPSPALASVPLFL